MLARAVLALVREPIIRRGVDALALVCREELVDVRDPHRAPDDLAHAGHEQVAALGDDGVTGVATRWHLGLLHVERLELGGEAVQEHGRADDVRHLALGCLGDVVADGVIDLNGLALRVLDHVAPCVLRVVLDPVLIQPRDGVDVGEALERT